MKLQTIAKYTKSGNSVRLTRGTETILVPREQVIQAAKMLGLPDWGEESIMQPLKGPGSRTLADRFFDRRPDDTIINALRS